MGRRTGNEAGAYRGSSAGSAMLSRDPLMILTTNPVLQVMLAVFAIFFGIRACLCVSLAVSPTAGRFPACSVRLRLLGQADLGTAVTSIDAATSIGCNRSGVIAFGLLRNGCPLAAWGVASREGIRHNTCGHAEPGSVKLLDEGVEGYENALICNEEMEWANGYYFEAFEDEIEAGWMVEVETGMHVPLKSADGARTWTAVGASIERHGLRGNIQLYPNLRSAFTAKSTHAGLASRRIRVARDLRPSAAWITINVFIFAAISICIFVLLLSGCLGRVEGLRPCVQALYVCVSILLFVGAAVCEPWQWREAVILAFRAVLRSSSALALLWGYRILHGLVFISAVEIAGVIAAEAVLYGPSLAGALQAVMAAGVPGQFILGVVTLALRRHAVAKAIRLVAADRTRYDAAWATICSSPEAAGEVEEMQVAASFPLEGCNRFKMGVMGSSWILRSEVGNLPTLSLASAIKYASRIATSAENSRIAPIVKADMQEASCVDQIFVQARFLQPILRDKVRGWAAKSSGLFRTVSGDLVQSPVASTINANIRWSSVKSPERVMEKLCRLYSKVHKTVTNCNEIPRPQQNGFPAREASCELWSFKDATRLVDVCRESIIYETPHDLAAGLRAVAADSEVLVVRVKNRHDTRSGAAESTGYRDVMLNLLINSTFTTDLGVARHVCEVQLILRAIAELKVNCIMMFLCVNTQAREGELVLPELRGIKRAFDDLDDLGERETSIVVDVELVQTGESEG